MIGRKIARFEGGDINVVVEIKWFIVAAAVDHTDVRRVDFVFWAIDEYREPFSIVAGGDDIGSRHNGAG